MKNYYQNNLSTLTRAIQLLKERGISFEYFVLLVPGSKTVPFKKLAKTRRAKKAGMVDPATAERLTGYQVGGISPFGMKQRLRVMIDAGLLSFDKVAINGGMRGLMLVMSPADILKVTDAEPIEL
jgi:Cys-tRNA(Pro)/Cys-tRNA(Cys) deacylase